MKNQKVKNSGELIIYTNAKGGVRLRADANKETIWATQEQIADLFNVQKAAVSKYIKNIFDTDELNRDATVSKMETVQIEGKRLIRRQIELYFLMAIKESDLFFLFHF